MSPPLIAGGGIAKSLIQTIIEELKHDPTCEQLLLSVGTFNAGARAVYRSLGFVGYGVEPRSLRAGNEYIDEEHMVLLLTRAR